MKVVTMNDIPREAAPMTGGLMTGTQVWRQPILQPADSSNFNFAIVAFDAGSRNKFHKHSGDQILIITSGPRASELEQLREFGLDVRNIGPDTGQASGIKMCYAAMTKGSSALYAQLLMAAELMGLSDHLKAEFQDGQGAVYQRMERGIAWGAC